MSGVAFHLKMQNFVAAFMKIIADEHALARASRRELAVMEGVLLVVLDSVTAELKRRDEQEGKVQ